MSITLMIQIVPNDLIRLKKTFKKGSKWKLKAKLDKMIIWVLIDH